MKKEQDWIYSRKDIVSPDWEPIMNALIDAIDEYRDKGNNYANDLRITYVKDKYWMLRCEYYWWNDYTTELIEAVETLSFYMGDNKWR